jgi:hypothetical protein
MAHFMQCFQFNMHLIESVLENRLIAPDSETRIWKRSDLFGHGEFLETTPLGGGITSPPLTSSSIDGSGFDWNSEENMIKWKGNFVAPLQKILNQVSYFLYICDLLFSVFRLTFSPIKCCIIS